MIYADNPHKLAMEKLAGTFEQLAALLEEAAECGDNDEGDRMAATVAAIEQIGKDAEARIREVLSANNEEA